MERWLRLFCCYPSEAKSCATLQDHFRWTLGDDPVRIYNPERGFSGNPMQKSKPRPNEESKNSAHGRITLKALASHLNLSPTTISFVVNGSPQASTISTKTQQRIWDAVAKFNYRPNIFARYLHTRRTFSIAIFVPEVSDEFSGALISGIERYLSQHNYFFFIVSYRGTPGILENPPDALLDRAVEGMIFLSAHVEHALPVPTVCVCDEVDRPGDTLVTIDEGKAALLALTHLAELGHREIAVIKGPENNGASEIRLQKILKACAAKGVRANRDQIVQLESDSADNTLRMAEGGYRATNKLLAEGRRFTALFAFNDASAIGAIRALADSGLRVPEDVSVIGFDDIPQSMFTVPRLTTIRQPLAAMGELAAKTLLKKITDGEMGPKALYMDTELIVRESTGPCSTLRRSLNGNGKRPR